MSTERLAEIERKLHDARCALESLSKHGCWSAVENTNDYIDRLVRERAELTAALSDVRPVPKG